MGKAETIIATLRANGYTTVASAVEEEYKAQNTARCPGCGCVEFIEREHSCCADCNRDTMRILAEKERPKHWTEQLAIMENNPE